MKKNFLMGLIGLSCLLPLGVNAETSENGVVKQESAAATVGEVETPVYNVEISWNTFEFNWKYNYETNQYEWEVEVDEQVISLSDYPEIDENYFNSVKHRICEDIECTIKISEDTTYEEVSSNIENYYIAMGALNTNDFHIGDSSTGGEITPSVKWTSNEGYEYVQGVFTYEGTVNRCELVDDEVMFDELTDDGQIMYSDSNCTTKIDESVTEFQSRIYYNSVGADMIELTTEEIPDNGRNIIADAGMSWYHLNLNLINKTKPTSTPKSGDEIGTITITLKAN